ncbi:MAG: hypothetical protein GX329_06600 [Tissierellia bacterium]|nr:hypothetical protein [Tissierellia bacterium]
MLCQNCNQNNATVHYTKIINGEVDELHLCEECSKGIDDFDASFSFHKLLTGLIDSVQAEPIERQDDDIKCKFCGLGYREFKKTGRFGCPDCYNSFKSRLIPLLNGIHGHNTHIGKVPKRANQEIVKRREIDRLRNELDILVREEAFEKAAVLRDRIRELEGQLGRE